MGTRTKVFTHLDAGMPTLNSASAGSLIAVLDLALVNGGSPVSVSSIVISGGVATVTTSAAHGFTEQGSAVTGTTQRLYPVVTIAGATPTGLNGDQRITSIPSTTTFTFATGLSDGSATGTITVKRASLGWAKVYSGTNKAVYQQTNPAGTRLYLRIDDSGTGRAKAQMYETMSDVDTGTRSSPDTSQISAGYIEWGYVLYPGSPKRFTLIGDDLLFYLLVENPNANQYDGQNYVCMGFGDPISNVPNDTYGCLLWGSRAQGYTGEDCFLYYQFGWRTAYCDSIYLARDYANASSTSVKAGVMWGFWETPYEYPNKADNSLLLQEVYLSENHVPGSAVYTVRGRWPGVYGFMHSNAHANGDGGGLSNKAAAFANNLSTWGPVNEWGGWTVLTHWTAGTQTDNNAGYIIAFNADGDWR